ncbi:hypothetical protein F5Y03DRAFT_17782 [Xylaria venustula]|nr:hypothetical protein F5Y03DRAFT_17782 [Xylaria venustula]
MTPTENLDPHSPFYNDKRDAFQPFSLGQHLAWAELRLVLAKLIWMFDFTAVSGQSLEWEQLRTFLVVEKKPIMVNVLKRQELQTPV